MTMNNQINMDKPKGYLCGRINGCTDEECRVWREAAKAALPEIDWIDPMDNDFRGAEDDNAEKLVDMDLSNVEQSDVMLVNADVAGWGSGAEFHHAWLRQTPIIALCPKGKPVSPWVRRASVIVHSIDEAKAWIIENFELEAA